MSANSNNVAVENAVAVTASADTETFIELDAAPAPPPPSPTTPLHKREESAISIKNVAAAMEGVVTTGNSESDMEKGIKITAAIESRFAALQMATIQSPANVTMPCRNDGDDILAETDVVSVTYIKETTVCDQKYNLPQQQQQQQQLQPQPQPQRLPPVVTARIIANESDTGYGEQEEETDSLSPLVVDNHTIIEHHERMYHMRSDGKLVPVIVADTGKINHHQQQQQQQLELELELEQQPINSDGRLDPLAPVFMRHSDTKDSISSIDSDLSLSYDRSNSATKVGSTAGSQRTLSDTNSSDDNAKDSGCDISGGQLSASDQKTVEEIEAAPVEIPDDDLAERIVVQVEFYFSDENILKDAFLLKHVRRNKEGFVSLKLISSFKRVRQLTKDWRAVGYAIKKLSKNIELNDLGTKVRRLEPLPLYDETTPSRTVVATDLPFDKLTIEKVSDLFSRCGEIALIRILRPRSSIPADVRQFINKYPEFQQNECALVEFIESQSARRAQSIEGLKVYEMVAPKKKTGKRVVANVTKLVENTKLTESEMERSRGGGGGGGGGGGVTNDKFKIRRSNSAFGFGNNKPADLSQHHSPYICPPRKFSFSSADNSPAFEASFMHRRGSAFAIVQTEPVGRKYSNCSEGYSSCSDMSRRTSNCSDMSSRRQSTSSECSCNCPRRMSQCNAEPFRRLSHCCGNPIAVNPYERKFIAGSSFDNGRRGSADIHYERKYSNGSMGFEVPRKYSGSFDPYYGGRKMSSDSGYERKFSTGSDCSVTGSRSRTGSLLCNGSGGTSETLVRSPMGPDGSKGFALRTRKIGQIIAPV